MTTECDGLVRDHERRQLPAREHSEHRKYVREHKEGALERILLPRDGATPNGRSKLAGLAPCIGILEGGSILHLQPK